MIQLPLDSLSLEQLENLAEDIRQRIIATCFKNGGHLGPSLGAVELAISLHAVFRSPKEPLIWDVGHQAYAHKLLTGRWDEFATLRQRRGISGFLSRSESEHDVFGGGHSSTAISAALANALARAGTDAWTVAIIGDGALSSGLAFEALNNMRERALGPLLIVVNDNQMSISPNSGAVAQILASDRAAEYFSLFGADYLGPLNGHDLSLLIGTLRGIKENLPQRPIVLHVVTEKGKGYAPAEAQPMSFHGIGPLKPAGKAARTFSEVFGDQILQLAKKDPAIVAVTAAMADGTGLSQFAQELPDRFFDVGIAEGHAVTFAAALATNGKKPYVAIYSTFLQRALDSVIHDVALQRLPVVFAVDRAGVVGPDGPTHHGAFDIAYFSMIPNLQLFAPMCLSDLAIVIERASHAPGPTAIRYPRSHGLENLEEPLDADLRWFKTTEKPKVIAVALGTAAARLKAAVATDPDLPITAIGCLSAKPIPAALLAYLRQNRESGLLVIEDGARLGGFGEHLAAELAGDSGTTELAAYPDRFIAHGTIAELEREMDLDVQGITERIQSLVSRCQNE